MKWEERFSIIPRIDQEHQQLFALIGELHQAMKTGQGKHIAQNIAERLMQYTKTHFQNEIQLLRNNNYPTVGNHEQEHEKLLNEAKGQLDKIKEGNINTLALMTFLEKWITDHILKHDMAYKDHLIARGVK